MRRRITRLIGAFLSIGQRFVPPAAPSVPTIVAVMTNATAGAITAVTKDAAVQDGDLLVSLIIGNAAGGPIMLTGVWTAIGEGQFGPSAARGQLYMRVASSEGASWSARVSTATAVRCTIVAIRGANVASPIGDASRTSVTVADATFATPTIDPVAVNSLLLALMAGPAGITWSTPSGMTELAADSATMSIGVFDVIQASTDPVSATATASGATVGGAALIALTPAA